MQLKIIHFDDFDVVFRVLEAVNLKTNVPYLILVFLLFG